MSRMTGSPTATGVVAVSDEHVVKLRDHRRDRAYCQAARGAVAAGIASVNATALAFLGATASVLGIFVFQRRLLLGAELQLADVELFLQALRSSWRMRILVMPSISAIRRVRRTNCGDHLVVWHCGQHLA